MMSTLGSSRATPRVSGYAEGKEPDTHAENGASEPVRPRQDRTDDCEESAPNQSAQSELHDPAQRRRRQADSAQDAEGVGARHGADQREKEEGPAQEHA